MKTEKNKYRVIYPAVHFEKGIQEIGSEGKNKITLHFRIECVEQNEQKEIIEDLIKLLNSKGNTIFFLVEQHPFKVHIKLCIETNLSKNALMREVENSI